MKSGLNQKGFTLIEIIAVLVILGILAAVAVPKYIDLQSDAKKKAMEGALAEGISTVSLAYAKLTLSNAAAPSAASIAARATAAPPSSADFGYAFAADGTTGVTVTVSALAGGKVSGASDVTKTWPLP